MTIQEAIKRMASANTELYSKVCTVDAVDERNRTVDCTPIDESAPVLSVNLQANQESEDGIVLFPAIGSYVVVSFINPSVAVVILCEKIDKIGLKIGETTAEIIDGKVNISIQDTTVEISATEILFNGGNLGGMVKIEELRKSLNSLKVYCETLKDAVSSGLNAVGAAMAASGQNGATAFETAMTSANIKIEEMENEKIKQ